MKRSNEQRVGVMVNNRLRLFIAALLLLTQIGCATGMSSSSPPVVVDIPAAWSASDDTVKTGGSSLVEWWSRFNDPQLDRLVFQAMQANTSVKSAKAMLRQARALRDVSAASLWPSINSSASAKRSKSGDNSAVNTFALGLDAGWEIDIFGANRSALDTSEATTRASYASLGDVQVSIAAEVALNYITLRDAQTRLAIANDNLLSQQETFQITHWRMQAGLTTSLEMDQAKSAAEQTRALLPPLQTTIETTCHALAVLTGQPPSALLTLLSAPGPIPKATDDLALTIPAETLRQRADVRATEHQVTAAVGRVKHAHAARLPSFTLNGSLGLNALTLGTLTDGASVVSALIAAISMPLLDGGAARAQVRAEQAALDQAILAYQAAVLTALTDVEDALVALRDDHKRLLHLQNAAESAANASVLACQLYNSGLVDFQTVLETQRTQLSTQDRVASARAEVSSDHVRLYKALGGGWFPSGPDAQSTSTEKPVRNPHS